MYIIYMYMLLFSMFLNFKYFQTEYDFAKYFSTKYYFVVYPMHIAYFNCQRIFYYIKTNFICSVLGVYSYILKTAAVNIVGLSLCPHFQELS